MQNIVVYMACELSVFQDQIPMTLKSLANPWLPPGSLHLDSEKAELTKATPKSHSKGTFSCKFASKDKFADLSSICHLREAIPFL